MLSRGRSTEPGERGVTYYAVLVFPSEEGDGTYSAVVPDLEGCTAHGATPEAALREAMVAQEAHAAVMHRDGWPLPEQPAVSRSVKCLLIPAKRRARRTKSGYDRGQGEEGVTVPARFLEP